VAKRSSCGRKRSKISIIVVRSAASVCFHSNSDALLMASPIKPAMTWQVRI
jgi:hypothetical protein